MSSYGIHSSPLSWWVVVVVEVQYIIVSIWRLQNIYRVHVVMVMWCMIILADKRSMRCWTRSQHWCNSEYHHASIYIHWLASSIRHIVHCCTITKYRDALRTCTELILCLTRYMKPQTKRYAPTKDGVYTLCEYERLWREASSSMLLSVSYCNLCWIWLVVCCLLVVKVGGNNLYVSFWSLILFGINIQ